MIDINNYLHEGHIDVFGLVATGQIAPDVHVVFVDDAGDHVRCGHSFSPLSSYKHPGFFYRSINVVNVTRAIRYAVVGYEVNLKEFGFPVKLRGLFSCNFLTTYT